MRSNRSRIPSYLDEEEFNILLAGPKGGSYVAQLWRGAPGAVYYLATWRPPSTLPPFGIAALRCHNPFRHISSPLQHRCEGWNAEARSYVWVRQEKKGLTGKRNTGNATFLATFSSPLFPASPLFFACKKIHFECISFPLAKNISHSPEPFNMTRILSLRNVISSNELAELEHDHRALQYSKIIAGWPAHIELLTCHRLQMWRHLRNKQMAELHKAENRS